MGVSKVTMWDVVEVTLACSFHPLTIVARRNEIRASQQQFFITQLQPMDCRNRDSCCKEPRPVRLCGNGPTVSTFRRVRELEAR